MAYPLADGTSIRSHPLLPTQKRTLHRIFLILHADLPRRARRPHGLAVDFGPRGVFRCGGVFLARREPQEPFFPPPIPAPPFPDRLHRRPPLHNRAAGFVAPSPTPPL